MAFFETTIDGLESIEEELDSEVSKINSQIPIALKRVGENMVTDLQSHVYTDWYLPWGKPKLYKRRTDNPSLGTPLGSEDYMETNISGRTLEFEYTPSGEHANSAWDTKSGDAIITTLQTDSGWRFPANFDLQGRLVMPRPFWNNFVQEQFNSEIAYQFRIGMGKEFGIKEEKNEIIAGKNESMLPQK